MAQQTNLAMHNLWSLPLVICFEKKFQTLHNYFPHSPKMHLECTIFFEILETKWNKILQNVKRKWILMLSPTKRMIIEYKTLFVMIMLDNLTNQQAKMNYGHLRDLQMLLGLIACILLLLESMHILIKFAHMKDVFMWNLVVAIKVCQVIYTTCIVNILLILWAVKSLFECKHVNLIDTLSLFWSLTFGLWKKCPTYMHQDLEIVMLTFVSKYVFVVVESLMENHCKDKSWNFSIGIILLLSLCVL